MQVYRVGSAPINHPPESTFTGDVRIGGYFQRSGPSRLSGATVTFGPGARTPWKDNPAGQTLVVVDGVGWAQTEGEDIVEIHAGDTVWFPPGHRHWEGGTPTHGMTYVAIQEEVGGWGVHFGAAVADEDYQQGPTEAG